MAALRGTIISDRSEATRLSHKTLRVKADTWRTFVAVELRADGSGKVTFRRNEGTQTLAEWGAE